MTDAGVRSEPVGRRLAAAGDLLLPSVREDAGAHDLDGLVQDLSPSGVAAMLGRLGEGDPPADAHDAAHLAHVEAGLRWHFGDFEAHRRDPLVHVSNLDLACYDRPYAPPAQRQAARARHLAAWPDAVEAALASMDAVTAPVARGLIGAVRGLAEGLDPLTDPAGVQVVTTALAAHARLVGHVEQFAANGDPSAAVGGRHVAAVLGTFNGLDIDLSELAIRADVERDRLTAMLAEACAVLAGRGETTGQVIARLLADHPDADGVLTEARQITAEVLAFTAEHELVPWTDGECLVEPAPASRSWAMAMMSWNGPEEAEAASMYYVTPPDPAWPAQEIEDWLAVFSRTTLPAITVHEVAPGHYAHGRALRRLTSPVRRRLLLPAFAEGWAHYVEELVAEEGFRAQDPRYLVGMCLEALVRVTRLRVSIGLHTGAMSLDDAVAAFRDDAHLAGPAAAAEANRGTFDLGYGCYTFGKLSLLASRERARAAWGAGFSLPRFHAALMTLGSPPLALVDDVLAP